MQRAVEGLRVLAIQEHVQGPKRDARQLFELPVRQVLVEADCVQLFEFLNGVRHGMDR